MNEPVYYTPRQVFDPAVIRIEDNLVHYSRSKLTEILIDEYAANLKLMNDYKNATDEYIRQQAKTAALKWIIYIRHSFHYGSIERRPVIVDHE